MQPCDLWTMTVEENWSTNMENHCPKIFATHVYPTGWWNPYYAEPWKTCIWNNAHSDQTASVESTMFVILVIFVENIYTFTRNQPTDPNTEMSATAGKTNLMALVICADPDHSLNWIYTGCITVTVAYKLTRNFWWNADTGIIWLARKNSFPSPYLTHNLDIRSLGFFFFFYFFYEKTGS